MSDIFKIIIVIALAYIALSAFVYFRQASIIYYPELMGRELTATPTDINLDYENVEFVTVDQLKLHGWFIPHNDARGTLLFFHGNAGNISHRLDSIAIFHQLKLNVFIFDYRGYGQSEGKVSEQGTYLDAQAAWDYLTDKRNIKHSEIILFGRSLGGSIAAWLAGWQQPAALIVESSFTSVPAMGQRLYPFLPIHWLAHFNYDTEAYLGKRACPLLIAHSLHDDIIPFEEGQLLYKAAHQPKQFYEMQGDHNNGFMLSGSAYIETLEKFINTSLKKQ